MVTTVTTEGLYWQGRVADFRRQLADWASFSGSLREYLNQNLH